jgi:OmcA/MtrC family decaheme c-type cytochrome
MRAKRINPRVALLLVLSLLIGPFGAGAFVGAPPQIYNALQKAFYLSPEERVYIRPGLKFDIQKVTIPDDRRPVVDFSISDDAGLPLDRDGILTAGAVNSSFILAYLPSPSGKDIPEYIDYNTSPQTSPITGVTAYQAATDSGGSYASQGGGFYTYTFGTVLPPNYDKNATHTLGVYATRDLQDYGLSTYVDNETYSFVPDGLPVSQIRQIVVTSACNQCHDPLSAHGSTGRRDVKICILCHTTQTFDPDTGNTVDMKVFIHRIHRGANLPSVLAGHPYKIIGFQQRVSDFSNVVFPQDIRNCTTCHRDSAQVNAWLFFPNIAACGSCHDNVNFATGEYHPGGPQANDNSCSSCHAPQETFEYDPSVPGAHTVPDQSTQLRNPKFTLLSINNTGPGQKPTIQFKITDKNGDLIAPSAMGRVAAAIGGPTSDYQTEFQEDLSGAAYAGGIASYTFSEAIPQDASGTYALEMEGYLNTTVIQNGDPNNSFVYRDAADNLTQYFAVIGATVVPRRSVVALQNCDQCHKKLQVHGNNRNQIEACVICHNPKAVDSDYRPTSEAPPTGIDFQILIHKIHTGVNLNDNFTVYGFGGSVNNFNGVLYPGDRRDCMKCHINQTFAVPLPPGVIPSVTPRFYYNPTSPISAACLACHDSITAAAHASVNTTSLGVSQPAVESCPVCHGESSDFAVSKVHAR